MSNEKVWGQHAPAYQRRMNEQLQELDALLEGWRERQPQDLAVFGTICFYSWRAPEGDPAAVSMASTINGEFSVYDFVSLAASAIECAVANGVPRPKVIDLLAYALKSKKFAPIEASLKGG